MEVARPEGILFDLGSTLLQDSLSGGLNTRLRAVLKSDSFAPLVENGFDLPASLASAMETVYNEGLGEFHVRKWLESSLDPRIPNSLGAPADLERMIRSTIIDYSPPDDASRVLRELIQLKIPMGVVSNSIFSGVLLKSDIERLSVLEAFQFVISSAEFGFRKPHPAIFEHGVSELGSTPSATWYVGDLWENDVLGSSGAGLIPVWLNATAAPPDVFVPHIRLKNWTELGKTLGI